MMEELTSRSETRKELERERRRIRDRQRRQSMSLEEKEKHLARRRRNYQLRRQRAEMARLNPPISLIQLPLSNALTCVSVSDVSPRCNADVAVAADADAFLRTDLGQQKRLMLDTGNSHSLDIPAHKLAILPGKVRLNRIKHLARAINDPVGDGVSIGGLMKENGTSNCKFKNSYHFILPFINELLKFRIMCLYIKKWCSGLSSKGLRLNRIKRLARTTKPAVQEILSQSHQSITEG
ncbi:hypothetical protein J1N35_032958 [Gossypium stocksii]|uniref:Uncharacterized protein n=1 Tax=Gossypium stocksii TaxID=47602 RepID=A0A9D3ZNT3_9ROSI|nr:hypothetical protein J1N35_032958 [Gossypium stocksii]